MNIGGLIFLDFKSGSHRWSIGAWVLYWWVYEGSNDRMHIEHQCYTVLLLNLWCGESVFVFSSEI